jgi:hypothetical protein
MPTRKPLRARQLCWCGCKTEISAGSYFARGHDKLAEAALLAAKYDGAVAQLLADHGFGPENSVAQAAVTNGGWERCPVCQHPGNDTTMRYHQAMHARPGGTEDYPFLALFEGDQHSHHARYEGDWPSVITRCGEPGRAVVIDPQRGILCPKCDKLTPKEA